MKPLRDFVIERYFAKYEFSVKYQLSCSDSEPIYMKQLLSSFASEPDDIRGLWVNLSLGYTETQGHPKLREEVANLYNNAITSEQVLTLTPEEGIYTFMKTYLKEDDEIIVTWPAYQSLHEIARSIGCRIRKWNYKVDNDNSPYFDINDLAEILSNDTKLLIMNFPHNPTGFTFDRSHLERIIKLCQENHCFIFSDEMYKGLLVDDTNTEPISLCQLTKDCIVLSGVSKTMGLPGLRIGWLIIQDSDLLLRVNGYKDFTSICASAPSEILAILGLRKAKKLIATNAKIIRDNIKFLKDFNERIPMFKFYKPIGGSVMYPELLVDDVDDFCTKLREQKAVALLSERIFNAENEDFKSQRVRIGLGRKDMNEVLTIVGDFFTSDYIST